MIVQGNSLLLRTLFQTSKCIVQSSNHARAISSGLSDAAYVVFQETEAAGIVAFNRPEGLNAISICMTHAIAAHVQEFEKHKKFIIMKSAVPKIFCVGGDLAEVSDLLTRGDNAALYTPRYAYELVNVIATTRVPYVALVDGITMGGGAGVSLLSKYSICTENTDFAMPETRMGLACDMGSSYYLSRLKNHVGFYLALTATRVNGYDNVFAGTATHFCESAKLPELEKALATTDDIDGAVNSICTKPEGAAYSLEPHLEKIDRIFSSESAEEIVAKLEEDGSAWAKKTAGIMRCVCPLALKAVLHNMHLGKNCSLDDCLQNEWILANSFFVGENFKEGFRALLKEKDNKPKWIPERLEDVTPSMIKDLYNVPLHWGPLELRPPPAKSEI